MTLNYTILSVKNDHLGRAAWALTSVKEQLKKIQKSQSRDEVKIGTFFTHLLT